MSGVGDIIKLLDMKSISNWFTSESFSSLENFMHRPNYQSKYRLYTLNYVIDY